MLDDLPPLTQRVRDETALAKRALQTELKKLSRLLGKLTQDAEACQGSEQLRLAGEVLKTALDQVPPGADRLTLPVPWLEAETVEIPLQRDLTPRQNLEKLFRRARGLAQGLQIVQQREVATHARIGKLQQHQAELEKLLVLAGQFDRQQPEALRPRDILKQTTAWLLAARQLGLKLPQPVNQPELRKVTKSREVPEGIRVFRSPLGAVVLAGKNAAGNDVLVTRLLRGRDVWLHLRDRPGAHVMLRVEGKNPPAEKEIHACAVLAAHLAGVDKGDVCDVTTCAGKDVRKVKGAPAGSVYLARERVLRVTVDAQVVDEFYARNR